MPSKVCEGSVGLVPGASWQRKVSLPWLRHMALDGYVRTLTLPHEMECLYWIASKMLQQNRS